MNFTELLQQVWGWSPEVALGAAEAYWDSNDLRASATWYCVRAVRVALLQRHPEYRAKFRARGVELVAEDVAYRAAGAVYAVTDGVQFAEWVTDMRRAFVLGEIAP